ncbi:AEC family transporter [Marinibactrum halimedae]|uniref:AEC family transporter n=1 Tax=Marinibactrum halimedae TaxID=1444977 RepID=A0AA37WNJ8_9GAMM|nr:AEC family transporter [Marinibactrum halimedae]MCD9458052.1 AEC family transporter [Marinibactrum halimedae]GLS27678.1 hypothetical protein GCM10007877_33970 [Marinibactrum halimedae]
MMTELFSILAPPFLCMVIGMAWVKGGSAFETEFVTKLVMWVGAPCLVVYVIGRSEVANQEILLVSAVALFVILFTGILGYITLRALRLDIATYLPPVLFSNNGYLGVPVALYAFGESGLALSLGFFIVFLVLQNSVGILFYNYGNQALSKNLTFVFRQPVFYGVLIGMGILQMGWEWPQWTGRSLQLLSGITIPLMMLTLGVSLIALKPSSVWIGLLVTLLRIGGGFLGAWLITGWMDLNPLLKAVCLVQASMPVAVFNYLYSLKFGQDHTAVAGTVVVSTLTSIITLPLVVAYALSLLR